MRPPLAACWSPDEEHRGGRHRVAEAHQQVGVATVFRDEGNGNLSILLIVVLSDLLDNENRLSP